MSEVNQNAVIPKLGEGIYLVRDIATILQLDYDKVYRWISGYWDEHFKSTFGTKKSKAVNFYSLIEFYTFYKLREKGVSAQELRQAHKIISEELNTPYPFATADALDFENRGRKKYVWYDKDGKNVRADGKHQISFKFIEPFLERIEFDKNHLAKRYFPLEHTKNIVVDPTRQFGQPIINGTSIKVETIFNLHQGGETNETICILYNLPIDKVNDAISFSLIAA